MNMNNHFRYTVIKKFLVFLFFGLIVLTIVKPSSGQSLWSSPIALSPEGYNAWFPDIVADLYGRVHAVWASGNAQYDEVFYTYTNTGYSWTTPNDILATLVIGNESFSTRPALMIDKNGQVNLSFVDSKAINYSRSTLLNASSALGWAPRIPMNGTQQGYFSRMASDSQNTLHFIYTENVPEGACPICYHIFYRQSSDAGNNWSKPVDIISRTIGASKPQILIDRNDNIHLVWESGQGGGTGQLVNPTSVTYAASYDKGKTWSTPVNLSKSADEMGKNIAIGIDRSGNLVVAWWSLPADIIKYQISTDSGKSWSTAAAIPGVFGAFAVYASNLDTYSFANDSDGNLHLVAVGRLSASQDSLNLLNLVWDGSQWQKPDVIATYKGDVPEWPRIAVSQGNQLFVVWFVRDQAHIWESNKGQYRVWFSRGYTSSQSVGPLPLPTVLPTKSTTPEILAKPSPTISSTVPVVETAITTAPIGVKGPNSTLPTSEAELLPLLAVAIIPSILLIIAIVLYKNMRQR